MLKDRQHFVRGFTLLELLVVMGIMALMMGIAVTGMFGIRRGAEMRGAQSTVRTTLMLARQHAITKRCTVEISFRTNTVSGTTGNFMRILARDSITSSVPIHADAYLPVGVEFLADVLTNSITFYPSGRTDPSLQTGQFWTDVRVREKVGQRGQNGQISTIRVWMLTGVTRVDP